MSVEDETNIGDQEQIVGVDTEKGKSEKPAELLNQPESQEQQEEESLVSHKEEDAILENWIRRDLEEDQNKKRQEPPVATPQQTAQIRDGFQSCVRVVGRVSTEQGIYTSAPDATTSNFGDEMWARDGSHAVQAALAVGDLTPAGQFLSTMFRFQREDGQLPTRYEASRHALKMARPLRWLKNIGIDVLTRKKPIPVFEGEGGSCHARDTVPTLVLAGLEYIRLSGDDKFLEENYEKMGKALEREIAMCGDDEDALISAKEGMPDWEDGIARKGKVANVNILMYGAVSRYAELSQRLREKEKKQGFAHRTGKYREEAERFGRLSERMRQSIMGKLWDEEAGYFKAQPEDDRFDTTANIFASLYLLNPAKREDRDKMLRIQQNIHSKVETSYGLRNFDPPYPRDMIAFRYKLGGIVDYHNRNAWPWVWGYNVVAKERLLAFMRDDDEKEGREKLKQEVVTDLDNMSQLFESSGGPSENYFTEGDRAGEPVSSAFYHSEPNFAGSASSFLLAAHTAQRLGLFPTLPKEVNVQDENGNPVLDENGKPKKVPF